jgi:hypothetical protein
MQRYDFCLDGMIGHRDGDWYRADDADVEIATLHARWEALKAMIGGMQGNFCYTRNETWRANVRDEVLKFMGDLEMGDEVKP